MAGGIALAALRDRDVDGELDDWLEEQDSEAAEFAFYPIHARYGSHFIAIRRSDREFIGIVDIPAPISRIEVDDTNS